MSEITKLLAAAGLLAAGFFSASIFGSPDAGPASTSPSDDWLPQPLQPLDTTAQLPPSAATLWDDQVASVGFTRYEQEPPQPVSVCGEHEVARPIWPDAPALPQTVANVPLVAAASGPPAPAVTGTFNNDWPPSIHAGDSRLASLSPPALLDGQLQAQPMHASQFPERPSAAAPKFVTSDPTPPVNPTPLDDRWSTARTDSWPATLSAPEVRSTPITTVSREPIWHVVADGDSLPKLAQHYLGDANRAREIYELNRDVLMNPDLLRIGEKLRIPQTSTVQRRFEVFDASGTQASSYEPQSRLVPLPELPDSVHAIPRARLQGPVSANMSTAGPAYGP